MGPRLVLALAAAIAVAGPARAADQHSSPEVRAVKRLPNGRVRSCTISCALIGRDHPRARLALHRKGSYRATLASLDDGARRRVAAGEELTPDGHGAFWVSGDVEKTAFSTPLTLELDFGDDGLEGSEDRSSRWLITSAHFRGTLGPTSAPHVFAAETAPVQAPEPSLYFKFKD